MQTRQKTVPSAVGRTSRVSGMDQFSDYWQKWRSQGERIDIFDSREPIGVGNYKLWKFLMKERRQWRNYLRRIYGFNVRTGKFSISRRYNDECGPISMLEQPSDDNQNTGDYFNLLSRRRACMRHPFYQAIEQYLTVCDCLIQRGDPPEMLANPHFIRYPEWGYFLKIDGVVYYKNFLLREINNADVRPGETWREYRMRPRNRFRCRDVQGAFYSVYMPLLKILDPDSGPEGDIDQFYGAYADSGISLTADRRLKKALSEDGADPYEQKRQLLPGVVMNKVLPEIWKIADPIEREAAFQKLPGKAAYQLGKVVGVNRRQPLPPTAEFKKIERERIRRILDERVAREQVNEQELRATKALLAKLPDRQRIVYEMNRIQQLTLKEIAERLNISPGTAASHLGRAKKRLDELKQDQKII